MQFLNNGQYQIANPNYQPYQGTNVQQWNLGQVQPQLTVEASMNASDLSIPWNYGDQQIGVQTVGQHFTSMGQIVSPSTGHQLESSFYSSPQSVSPQSTASSSSSQMADGAKASLGPNLNQVAFVEGQVTHGNFSSPEVSSNQSTDDSSAFQTSDFNQLLNISAGELFDGSQQQVDYNQEQLLNYILGSGDENQAAAAAEGQQETSSSSGDLFSASNDHGSNQNAVKVEAANSAEIWDELLSIIQDD